MSEPKSQQEPSMEEILASIRRIISEDGAPGEKPGEAEAGETAEAEPAAEPPADEPEPEEDMVLELTQVVEDEEPEDGDEASAAEAFAAAAEPESVPEPAVAEPPRAPEDTAAGLLSAAAAGATESQLSSLVAAVDRAHGGTPIGAGNRTIEDLVKEVMRPMIKDWLDAHLPALVERIVRREVERLSRRAEGDE